MGADTGGTISTAVKDSAKNSEYLIQIVVWRPRKAVGHAY